MLTVGGMGSLATMSTNSHMGGNGMSMMPAGNAMAAHAVQQTTFPTANTGMPTTNPLFGAPPSPMTSNPGGMVIGHVG